MPRQKPPDAAYADRPTPTVLELPQVCLRRRNEYVNAQCDVPSVRVPTIDCRTVCCAVPKPRIVVERCEMPQIRYRRTVVEKPKLCLTAQKCDIAKPCLELRPRTLMQTKTCRVHVDVPRPCVRRVKPPRIVCDEPFPITVPKIEMREVKCCVPKTICQPIRVDCPTLCDKSVRIEVPTVCVRPEPMRIDVPIIRALEMPPDCPADCSKPC